MAYNVDTWLTEELVNLRIPLASLYKHPRHDWHPERVDHDDGTVTFNLAEMTEIRGRIVGDVLDVYEIEACAEGSGTAMRWVIEPALFDSKGTLVAYRVWEGGDEIDRLTVNDGFVNSTEIE